MQNSHSHSEVLKDNTVNTMYACILQIDEVASDVMASCSHVLLSCMQFFFFLQWLSKAKLNLW